MRRQRQRHFGEVGIRQHRRVAELTQHLVERHAMFEALDDMAAQLRPDLLPARHRRRHVAENGLDVLFCSHRYPPGDFVPRTPLRRRSRGPRAPLPLAAGARLRRCTAPGLARTPNPEPANPSPEPATHYCLSNLAIALANVVHSSRKRSSSSRPSSVNR